MTLSENFEFAKLVWVTVKSPLVPFVPFVPFRPLVRSECDAMIAVRIKKACLSQGILVE